MKKKVLVLISTFVAVLIVRLFFGVYDHDEFAESSLFVKHRPTWKWKFHSPQGMSDKKMEDFSKEEQVEQKYFNEFVLDKGLSR